MFDQPKYMKAYISYKENIRGFQDVSATVKTVEKVAASSISSLKKEVAAMQQYLNYLDTVLGTLLNFYLPADHYLLIPPRHPAHKKALIILAGDKGLVGGLWHNLVSHLLSVSHDYHYIILRGDKGKRFLMEEEMKWWKFYAQQDFDNEETQSSQLMEMVFEGIRNQSFDQVDVLYPQFDSLAQQLPTIATLVPFNFDHRLGEQGKTNSQSAEGLPVFEGSKKELFDRLLQKYIKVFFYQIIMETKLSELSARTVAMEHASVMSDRLVRQMFAEFLKARRQTMTQKQLEIFSIHRNLS